MLETAPEPTPVKAAAGPEFTVSRHDLLKELSELHKVVERKSTVPVLANILVQATENVLALTATDLDLSLRTVCPARVKKEGRCTIPAQKLYDYVRLLEDGEIAIRSLENNWLQIRSGRSHTKMTGLSSDSFPSLPLFPSESAIRLESAIMRNLIAKTMFAISAEESRYILNGALLLLKPQAITMVATDGHRLAHAEQSKSQCTKEARLLVPKKALIQLNALLNSSTAEHILFAQDASSLFFAVGNRLLTSRQLAGNFPNYEAVMPREHKGEAVISKDELFTAIQRVSQFSDEHSNSVRMRLSNKELTISSSNAETGESEDVVESSYAGEPAVVAFNSRYLLEFLKAVESSRVRFEFKDGQSASELRPADPGQDDCTYRYVVMPVRV
jgi:DNA polymerase III subunit beta